MKNVRVFALLLGATLAVGVVAAYGYQKITPRKTVVGSNICFVACDKNQLVKDATAIVSGEVISSEVQDDLRGFPATDFMIKVDKVFRGNPGAQVEVRTEGGENDKMIYIPDEAAITFQIGEQVVLFLNDDKGDRTDKDDFGYYVVGGYQGKFKEENGKLRNEKFVFDAATFAQEIEQIEKQNQAKGLNKLKANRDNELMLRGLFGSGAEKTFATVKEALEYLPAKVKVPDASVTANPKGIYVMEAPRADMKCLYIEYESGMQLMIDLNSKPQNSSIESIYPDLGFNERIIDLQGVQAMVRETYDQTTALDGIVAVPAVVVWLEEGTQYSVYGKEDEAGKRLKLENILPAAYSIRNSTLQ